MAKQTKPTKSEIKELHAKFRARVMAASKHGYDIKHHSSGGEVSYYVYKNGECIHPGIAYEEEYNALLLAEEKINSLC